MEPYSRWEANGKERYHKCAEATRALPFRGLGMQHKPGHSAIEEKAGAMAQCLFTACIDSWRAELEYVFDPPVLVNRFVLRLLLELSPFDEL